MELSGTDVTLRRCHICGGEQHWFDIVSQTGRFSACMAGSGHNVGISFQKFLSGERWRPIFSWYRNHAVHDPPKLVDTPRSWRC